jgi:hypothetical protein
MEMTMLKLWATAHVRVATKHMLVVGRADPHGDVVVLRRVRDYKTACGVVVEGEFEVELNAVLVIRAGRHVVAVQQRHPHVRRGAT